MCGFVVHGLLYNGVYRAARLESQRLLQWFHDGGYSVEHGMVILGFLVSVFDLLFSVESRTSSL